MNCGPLLLLVLVLSACGSADLQPAPVAWAGGVVAADETLATAAAGLLYLSESDADWTPVQLASTLQPLPTSGVLFSAMVRVDADSFEEINFTRFFDRLTHLTGDAERYAVLEQVFRRDYLAVGAYRVRESASTWRIYLLGVNAAGISELWTTAVET